MASVSVTGTHNLTFLHIPQNAGVSIGHWLQLISGEYTLKNKLSFGHDTITEIVGNHPKLSTIRSSHPTNYTFTVVRNPWDRIVSAYYRVATVLSDADRTAFLSANGWSSMPTFDAFVTKGTSITASTWEPGAGATQYSWIDASIDLVIKYEDLETGLQTIRDMFGGATTALPVENVSTRNKNYKTYYNATTQAAVATAYAADISAWGYTF